MLAFDRNRNPNLQKTSTVETPYLPRNNTNSNINSHLPPWSTNGTTMAAPGTINLFATAVMPVSQSYLWYKLFSSTTNESLYATLFQGSAFYCAWALEKRFIEGNAKELGHISMGLLAAASFSEHRIAALLANGLVVANFALPAYMLLPWPLAKLVKVVKNMSIDQPRAKLWAITFKTYFVVSLGFWSLTAYKLAMLEESSTA
jgi:hypothetical protein